MFAVRRKTEAHPLDDIIDGLYSSLRGLDEDTEMYGENVKQLKTLMDLRSRDRGDREPASAGQWLAVGANVLGILAVLNHERVNVITTKAIGFVSKVNTNP